MRKKTNALRLPYKSANLLHKPRNKLAIDPLMKKGHVHRKITAYEIEKRLWKEELEEYENDNRSC